MRGSIRPGKEPKSWHLYYRAPIAPGERRRTDQKRETIFGVNKTEAKRILDQRLAEVATGRYFGETRMTLGDYLRESVERADIATTTRQRYESLVKQIIANISGGEGLLLSEVTPPIVDALIARLRKRGGVDGRPLSSTTVRQSYAVLSKALRKAARQRVIQYNPCDSVEPPKPRSPKVKILEPHALAKFLGEMRDKEASFFAASLLAGCSGLRRGELLALRWSDIDFATGVITVERAAEETHHTIGLKTPKSGRTRFSVLPASAIAALQVVRVEQGLLAERMGPEWNVDGLILPCVATGRLWTPSMFSKSYAAAVAKTTFRKVGLHQLRHSFVSNAVHAGVDAKTVQLIAGHASASFTLDRYAHQASGANALAASKLDAALIAAGFTTEPKA